MSYILNEFNTSQMEIINDHPPVEATVDLLNSAFGYWGDEELFRWRYFDYPGYSADHNYYIMDEDELIAFTRLYSQMLEADGPLNAYTWGDSVVHEDHRGKGLYTRLKEIEEERTSREADLSMSFNTKDKIPYYVHLKDGWGVKQIPLYLKILSPSVVLKQYMEEGLRNRPWLKRGLDIFGSRLVLDVEGEEVELSEVLDKGEGGFKFKIPMKGDRFAKLVEGLTSVRDLRSVFSDSGGSERETVDLPVEHGDSVELSEVMELYSKVLKGYDVMFQRSEEQVAHMLRYPHIVDVMTVREDDLVGFAVIGKHPKPYLNEFRVLDMVYDDLSVYDALVEEIESTGDLMGADSIFMVSPDAVPPGWVEVGNRVIMWDKVDLFESENWRLGIYDMV